MRKADLAGEQQVEGVGGGGRSQQRQQEEANP